MLIRAGLSSGGRPWSSAHLTFELSDSIETALKDGPIPLLSPFPLV